MTSYPMYSKVCFTVTLLPPTNEVCEGYVFTGVCLSTRGVVHGFIRGACMVLFGGICGFFRGACMVFAGGMWWFFQFFWIK